MIAWLGMYDPRWLHPATDALWQAIAMQLRGRGIAGVPDNLSRACAPDVIWTAPDLLLAQTCGYPLMTRLGSAVELVATPIYHAQGCDGALHRSAIIVRRDDRAITLADCTGYRAAINARDSNTGMNLLRAAFAPLARQGRFFSTVVETGAHARSVWAVIARQADVAAIDAVTLALLRDRYPGIDRRVRVLEWTAPSPGLPLVTSAHQPPATIAALRAALCAVIEDPVLGPARQALRLIGMTVLDRSAYDTVLQLERRAIDAGYPSLS